SEGQGSDCCECGYGYHGPEQAPVDTPGAQSDQVEPDEGGDGAGQSDDDHALSGQQNADNGEDDAEKQSLPSAAAGRLRREISGSGEGSRTSQGRSERGGRLRRGAQCGGTDRRCLGCR